VTAAPDYLELARLVARVESRKPRREKPLNPMVIADSLRVSRSLVVFRDKRHEGRCRMCQRPEGVRPLTQHHLIPLAWFHEQANRRAKVLRNVAANKVPLCRPCHDQVESRVASEKRQARRELRVLLSPDETAFVIQVAKESWLNRKYPARGVALSNVVR